MSAPQTFDLLTPQVAVRALEATYDLQLDGTLVNYPSYVNRVYGVTGDDGRPYVAKFYRPGRWTRAAVAEEHTFVADCARLELPVVAPMADEEGETLHVVTAVDGVVEQDYLFTCYPKRSGRNFDAERDSDWQRLGSVVGRVHQAAVTDTAEHRLQCLPDASTADFVAELRAADVVHPECAPTFFELADTALAQIRPLFAGQTLQRLHGDCHRGNILDRAEQGLLIIDFDDMMIGPAVQDLWLLLPGRLDESGREVDLILAGYEQFRPFDAATLRLVEPLRLMRMIYFLAWQARQRDDFGFQTAFPGWGTRAFWIKEIEDLRTQLEVVGAA